jgi:hypothetical protein
MARESFSKYLEISLGSRKINKSKFIEVKINEVLEELDKIEFSVLALNQMLKVVKSFLTNN